ncbi:MAG: hypothetical protein JW920_10890, partial [Deltaproteobacteria bacterium]|nr:hypothetical protein [Deltaproteobacteria bacterium]
MRQTISELVLIIEDSIGKTVQSYLPRSRNVEDYQFKRLPHYFPADLLKNTHVAVVDTIPVPQIDDPGIESLIDFNSFYITGITYNTIYFIKRGHELSESLHFHELIHVIQWQYLGAREFLTRYLTNLLTSGYRHNPYEEIA